MRVPIVDQHGHAMGTAPMPPALIEAYTDDDGVVWTAPSAWAYFAACRALHRWSERARLAERHLAWLVDAINEHQDALAILVGAEAFLKTKMGILP